MAKKIVVKGDGVAGTDTHAVTGFMKPTPPSTPPYAGQGTYSYDGTVTADLSGLVTIAGTPVALVTSGCTWSSPHVAADGDTFDPPTVDTENTVSFVAAPDGKGRPGQGAGSSFVTVEGKAVLRDGDPIDTCGGERGHGNSSVTASGQDFVQVAR